MKFELSLRPIQEANVSAFEKMIGFKLPPDYREFLLKHNGGRPQHPVLELPTGKIAVNDLYGLGEESERVGDLQRTWEIFDDRIPSNFLAIGDTAGGDQFLLSIADAGVYLFDHENEPEDTSDDVRDYDNIRKVAVSFLDFVDDLKPYE